MTPMPRPATIRSAALGLSPRRRAALAHDLIQSLDAHEANADAERLWTEEIRRRSQEVDDGKVRLVDAADVHRGIAERIRTRGRR